jgi:hypothetical protein
MSLEGGHRGHLGRDRSRARSRKPNVPPHECPNAPLALRVSQPLTRSAYSDHQAFKLHSVIAQPGRRSLPQCCDPVRACRTLRTVRAACQRPARPGRPAQWVGRRLRVGELNRAAWGYLDWPGKRSACQWPRRASPPYCAAAFERPTHWQQPPNWASHKALV